MKYLRFIILTQSGHSTHISYTFKKKRKKHISMTKVIALILFTSSKIYIHDVYCYSVRLEIFFVLVFLVAY